MLIYLQLVVELDLDPLWLELDKFWSLSRAYDLRLSCLIFSSTHLL